MAIRGNSIRRTSRSADVIDLQLQKAGVRLTMMLIGRLGSSVGTIITSKRRLFNLLAAVSR